MGQGMLAGRVAQQDQVRRVQRLAARPPADGQLGGDQVGPPAGVGPVPQPGPLGDRRDLAAEGEAVGVGPWALQPPLEHGQPEPGLLAPGAAGGVGPVQGPGIGPGAAGGHDRGQPAGRLAGLGRASHGRGGGWQARRRGQPDRVHAPCRHVPRFSWTSSHHLARRHMGVDLGRDRSAHGVRAGAAPGAVGRSRHPWAGDHRHRRGRRRHRQHRPGGPVRPQGGARGHRHLPQRGPRPRADRQGRGGRGRPRARGRRPHLPGPPGRQAGGRRPGCR